MTYKLILTPFYGESQDRQVVTTALSLARLFDSHVRCLQVLPEPEAALADPYIGLIPICDIAALVEKENEKARLEADKALRDHAAAEGIDVEPACRFNGQLSLSWHSMLGDAQGEFTQQARLHDLTVISAKADEKYYTASLLKSVLFGSARPVLVVPENDKAIHRFRNIAIAWDGQPRATRAVAAALPLLKQAETVTVLTVQNPGDDLRETDLVHYLKAHGVKAEHRRLEAEVCIEDTLFFALESMLPDLVVMGAYEHSQFRESVIGGTTRRLLEDSPVPLFMTH